MVNADELQLKLEEYFKTGDFSIIYECSKPVLEQEARATLQKCPDIGMSLEEIQNHYGEQLWVSSVFKNGYTPNTSSKFIQRLYHFIRQRAHDLIQQHYQNKKLATVSLDALNWDKVHEACSFIDPGYAAYDILDEFEISLQAYAEQISTKQAEMIRVLSRDTRASEILPYLGEEEYSANVRQMVCRTRKNFGEFFQKYNEYK